MEERQETPGSACSRSRCDECGGWGGRQDPCCDQWYTCDHGCKTPRERARIPVPAPWDTDAYIADCRRRGVEPGQLPSLGFREQDRRPGEQGWFLKPAIDDVPTVVACGSVAVYISRAGIYVRSKIGASIDDLLGAADLVRVLKDMGQ